MKKCNKMLLLLCTILCIITQIFNNTSNYCIYAEDYLNEIMQCFVAAGFTKEAAAGICGNAAGESSGNPAASQSGGAGIGIFQWSNTNRQRLEDYCAGSNHSSHAKVTLKGYTICNRVDCQVAFAIVEGAENLSTVWSKYYNSQVSSLPVLSSAASSNKIPTTISTSATFKNITSLEEATIRYYLDYERAGATKCFWVGNSDYDASKASSFVEGYKKRYSYALSTYNNYTGGTYTPSDGSGDSGTGDTETSSGTNDASLAASVGSQLNSIGYFADESELAAYCKLTEISIDDIYIANASKDNLEQDDLEGLVSWERNVNSANEENGWIAFLRRIVAFIGIIFIVWSLLIYLAYWLDNINNVVEISVLGIVTFGQLHVCYGDDKPTFRLGKENGKVKTVSHSQIVGISLLLILFGVSLVSGFFYQVVSYFVNTVLEILGLV